MKISDSTIAEVKAVAEWGRQREDRRRNPEPSAVALTYEWLLEHCGCPTWPRQKIVGIIDRPDDELLIILCKDDPEWAA